MEKMTKEQWVLLAVITLILGGIVCFVKLAPVWTTISVLISLALGVVVGIYLRRWYEKYNRK